MSHELAVSGPGDVSLSRHPDTVLQEAALVAKSVERLVKTRPDLVQVIGGRKHPRFELLQIVGSMFRVTTRVVRTTPISNPDGWEAVAEAVHVPSGQVVSVGEGMCTSDEPSWHMRPKYEWRNGRREKVGEEPVTSHQRRSMAQTRACSKALRLALGWVLGLAGYEATAAEELDDGQVAQPHPQLRRTRKQAVTQQQAETAPAPENITDEQRRLLWEEARRLGVSEAGLRMLIEARGYRSTREIRREDYEAILALLRAHGTDELRDAKAAADMEAGR